MTIVVDTNVVVDLLRRLSPAREALGAVLASDERVTASVLTKTELIAGRRPGEEEPLARFLRQIEWIPVDEPIAERAGELASTFLRSYPGIELADYVVAATAQLLRAELWTRNRKHFPMFPDLAEPYAG